MSTCRYALFGWHQCVLGGKILKWLCRCHNLNLLFTLICLLSKFQGIGFYGQIRQPIHPCGLLLSSLLSVISIAFFPASVYHVILSYYNLYPTICISAFNTKMQASRPCHLLSLLPRAIQVLYIWDACYTLQRSKALHFKSDLVPTCFLPLTHHLLCQHWIKLDPGVEW